jgi:predicted PhzF superfamily epimerase YddE/YHI9
MDFPARRMASVSTPPELAEALGAGPLDVAVDAHNYLAVLDSEEVVRELAPDIPAVARLDRSGLIVTARSNSVYDFVSRYFAPAKGIAEDSVTGGAHCALAPYWSTRLRKTAFRAFQASQRGGEVVCRLVGDRVELEGGCVFYLEGEVEI